MLEDLIAPIGRLPAPGEPGAQQAPGLPGDPGAWLRAGLAAAPPVGDTAQVLAGGGAAALVPILASRLADHIGLDGGGSAFAAAYALADACAEAGELGEAAVLLAALAVTPGAERDGLVGLSVLAVRTGRNDAALALATESLHGEHKHPRACCVAGLCEWERGDRRAAQSYFAAAARLARKHPEFREDLKAAQRALLLMHLA